MSDQLDGLRAMVRQLGIISANFDTNIGVDATVVMALNRTVCASLELVIQLCERLVQTAERVDELTDAVWPE